MVRNAPAPEDTLVGVSRGCYRRGSRGVPLRRDVTRRRRGVTPVGSHSVSQHHHRSSVFVWCRYRQQLPLSADFGRGNHGPIHQDD